MGQKVHPIGMRLGIIKRHSAIWYAEKGEYAKNLIADLKLREAFHKRLAKSSVSEIIIERESKKAQVTIRTAAPGVVIGRKGTEIDVLTGIAAKCLKMEKSDVYINIQEISKPDLESKLVADNIARQLERRVMFRRAMKRAVANTMSAGAEGVKIEVSGRLAGADIARSESYKEGRVPLHTLRADIDYAIAEAMTTYGVIGVKVWIFRGEIFDVAKQFSTTTTEEPRSSRRGKPSMRSGKPKSGDARGRRGPRDGREGHRDGAREGSRDGREGPRDGAREGSRDGAREGKTEA